MIVFFGIVIVLGIIMVLLDFAAMANSVAPSQYSQDVTFLGVIFIAVGAVGAGCAWVFG